MVLFLRALGCLSLKHVVPLIAVNIFAILKSKDGNHRVLVVKQYRPPLKKYTIELPAGELLMDLARLSLLGLVYSCIDAVMYHRCAGLVDDNESPKVSKLCMGTVPVYSVLRWFPASHSPGIFTSF